MAKKFFAGLLAGGLAATAIWKSMDDSKKEQMKDLFNKKKLDAQDWASDYALELLDAVDNIMANHPEMADRLKSVSDFANKESNQFADHFMSDDFDQETAEIRDSLAREKDNENDDSDDIIIDKTEK